VLCVRSSEWEVAFIGKEGWWSAGGHMSGVAGSGGAVGPMIHRLLVLDTHNHCSWGGYRSVPLVGFARHVMHRLRSGTPRIASEWLLWRLSGRSSGPIDPSLHLWIKLTFFSESCSSKCCSRERRCSRPDKSHEAGPTAPGMARRTCRAGRTRWFGHALLMWHVGSNFSQNVYLPMKFTTQLVELY
jgi:hypothetical protein